MKKIRSKYLMFILILLVIFLILSGFYLYKRYIRIHLDLSDVSTAYIINQEDNSKYYLKRDDINNLVSLYNQSKYTNKNFGTTHSYELTFILKNNHKITVYIGSQHYQTVINNGQFNIINEELKNYVYNLFSQN